MEFKAKFLRKIFIFLIIVVLIVFYSHLMVDRPEKLFTEISSSDKNFLHYQNLKRLTFNNVKIIERKEDVIIVEYDLLKPVPKELDNIECVLLKKAAPAYYFCLHENDEVFSNQVKSQQLWEPEIQEMIKRFFADFSDATFVDLGANVGLHSLYAAKLRKDIEVIAVEPFPQNVVRFHKAAVLNNVTEQIKLLVAGVSNQRGFVNDNEDKIIIKCCSNWTDDENLKIPLIVLDDLVPFISKPTVFMKIDIEGGECTLFSNARQFFSKFRVPIIIMETGVTMRSQNVSCVESMLNFLDEFKYKAFYPYDNLDPKVALRFSNWTSNEIWETVNILFKQFN